MPVTEDSIDIASNKKLSITDFLIMFSTLMLIIKLIC